MKNTVIEYLENKLSNLQAIANETLQDAKQYESEEGLLQLQSTINMDVNAFETVLKLLK